MKRSKSTMATLEVRKVPRMTTPSGETSIVAQRNARVRKKPVTAAVTIPIP